MSKKVGIDFSGIDWGQNQKLSDEWLKKKL